VNRAAAHKRGSVLPAGDGTPPRAHAYLRAIT
jgi:hypothetical protein